MLARKIINILSVFNGKDWTAFDRWMNSPAHNTDAGLLNLAHYYQSLAPAFAPEELVPEKQWQVIYPGRPLKEGVLRVKIRQLTSQVEDFLIAKELEKNDFLRGILLLRSRRPHLSFKHYEKETLKLIARQDQHSANSQDAYRRELALRNELRLHPGFDPDPGSGAHLKKLDENVDAWFTVMKYRLRNHLQARKRILGEDYPQRFLEAIHKERALGLLQGDASITLYTKLSDLLSAHDSSSDLSDLRNLFERQSAQLPDTDRRAIFYTILNYLSRCINQGEDRYEEMLNWYRIGLDTGVMLIEGTISSTTFNNIVLLGYRSGMMDWTDDFLNAYGKYLQKDEREDTLTGSRGTGAFYRGDYMEVVRILSPLRSGRNLKLRSRLTVVRALFELLISGEGEYEAIDQAITNFESRLQRETHFSRSVLTPYRNHLRLLRRLTKIWIKGAKNPKALTRLQEEVETEKALVAQAWLLEKVELIAKGLPKNNLSV